MRWRSWPMRGFPSPSLSIPTPMFGSKGKCISLYTATGSMELSSNGSSWHYLFCKARVIRHIQEEPNPSFFFMFNGGIPSCCFLLSLTERLPHYSLLGSPLLSCGSCCGLISSRHKTDRTQLVLFMYVSMCRVQINSAGMAPHPGKVLD